MEAVFLKLVNLSLAAGWLVLAVLVLRLAFRRAPRWAFCLLWGLVALRLVCPVSPRSPLSLIPSAQPLPPEILCTARPQIDSGFDVVDRAVNPILAQALAPSPAASANPTQIWSFLLARVWLVGVAAMGGYALVSYVRLKRRVATATRLRDNIRQSEGAAVPFVLGMVHPVIYLPYGLAEEDLTHVIAHEQAHICRRDHWWKGLGFLLLSVYWFHPLLWVAYVVFCRDMERACDERAVRTMGKEERRGYSAALLHCSVRGQRTGACPLAFGEVGVKERVRAIMEYRPTTRRRMASALAVCAVAAVCFLTHPPARRVFLAGESGASGPDPRRTVAWIAELERLESASQLCVNGDQAPLRLTAGLRWEDGQAVRFFYGRNGATYSARLWWSAAEDRYRVTEAEPWPEQSRVFSLQTYLEALRYLPREAVEALAPGAAGYSVTLAEEGTPESLPGSISYHANGVGETEGWYIHLEVLPRYEGAGGPEGDALHLFYGEAE